jgi:hypothetical protein
LKEALEPLMEAEAKIENKAHTESPASIRTFVEKNNPDLVKVSWHLVVCNQNTVLT